MRKRYFHSSSKKNNKYFYFDTLIIKKKYRGLNLSKKIINKCKMISNNTMMPIILICEKKHINFYKKNGFNLLNNKNLFFKDHKFNKYSMIYIKKNKSYFLVEKLKIFLN